MRAIDIPLNELLGGYAENELRAAFERVQNKDHWKGPIDIVVVDRPEAIAMIAYAIEFYTATKAKIIEEGPASFGVSLPAGFLSYHIQAPGYWAGPAN